VIDHQFKYSIEYGVLKIGDRTISSQCVLAPLAGISDLPFRLINRRMGCEFAFIEMISARALVCQSKTTGKMLESAPEDRPLGVQLLGEDPEIMKAALDTLREHAFDLIDVNAACPVGKVTCRGEGAGLLREPLKLQAVLKAVVENSSVPVTVKIRSGWDDSSISAMDVALYAQDSGIDGLIIHGRTKVQGYSGGVDYNVIREVKDSLHIPVIASGDALSPRLIKKLFDETGCDGVAIARGSLGNPWIFRETSAFLRSGNLPERPDINERTNTMISHLDLCCRYHGERMGTMIFRKFFAWYIRGLPGNKKLKANAFRTKTRREILDLIWEVRESATDFSPCHEETYYTDNGCTGCK
jgi:nifR3 family TIM-barrel protein